MSNEIKIIREPKSDLENSIEKFEAWWALERNRISKLCELMDAIVFEKDIKVLREQSFRAWEAHRKFSK